MSLSDFDGAMCRAIARCRVSEVFAVELSGIDGNLEICPGIGGGQLRSIKPAEQAPLSALLMARLFVEAGAPPGVFNVITAFRRLSGVNENVLTADLRRTGESYFCHIIMHC